MNNRLLLRAPKNGSVKSRRGAVAQGNLLIVAGLLTSLPAIGQEALEEIVVTGTSIRGAAPVGSNLIVLDRETIEATGAQTVQQILRSVPAVTGFGNASQGGFGSADGAGTFAPTIHGLGASASNGTLVLIDGHRIPLTGINHTLVDPNVIAPLAIERVEVLPDGASSTYGSDAVAGVLNFITRRNYEGFEMSGQAGFGDGYDTKNGNFLFGDTWDRGSVLVAYGYSERSALNAADRSFTNADHRAQGGGNFANFNCSPASVQPAGAGTPVYAYPYTGTGVANSATTGFCDFTGVADLLPQDIRHNLLVKLSHEVNDSLSLNADVVYSKESNIAAIARGSVTATVFSASPPGGTGQANPFFAGPPGVTTETVRFQADDLLGPGARNKGGAETFFVTAGAEYKFGGDWQATIGTTLGKDDSQLEREGALCVSCALLALNGTTNQVGSLIAASVPGTTTAITQQLTAANALDVWSPVGSNRTSAAVLQQLTDSNTLAQAHQTLKDAIVKFDGPLFSIPGGSVRAAVGGEVIMYDLRQQVSRERNTGPASLNSTTLSLSYERKVTSGFAELLIPVVGSDNALPLVRSLDVNLAGRYDKYDDFGDTTNPKFALNWEMFSGFSIRGNYARSFTAPALTSRGNANGLTAESGYGNSIFGPITISTAAYPNAIGLPGCNAGAATCTIGTAAAPGIILAGGNKDLKPQKGNTFSVGFDWAPDFAPGLRMSATYWNAEYIGAVTAPVPAFAVNAAGLNSLLTIFPGGATPAQIAALTAGLPILSAPPAPIYFVYNFQQRNALNLQADGIDAEIAYRFDTGIGTFSAALSGSRKLTMDQQVGTGGATFSVLNTSGFNTTFPSNEFAGRMDLGWKLGGLTTNVFVNYMGSYVNWNGNAPFPLVRSAAGVPIGGGQPIPSFTTVDLHVSYDFEGTGAFSGTQLFVDGSNVLDEEPPFYNVAAGYDTSSANPIGRVLTVGVSKKW
jgi:iron complex outermembrane receptor protein